MLDWNAWQEIVRAAAVRRQETATTPWDGWTLGNADMGAVTWGPAHDLTFRLTKLDLWDARMNAEHYMHPRPLSEFVRWIRQQTANLGPNAAFQENLNGSWTVEKLYPCMRIAADLHVHVSQCQGLPVPLTQTLHLDQGLYEAEFIIGWWKPQPTIRLRAFVSWQRNVLALRFDCAPHTSRCLILRLSRDPYGGRTWGMLSAGPSLRDKGLGQIQRDPRAGMLPPAVTRIDDGAGRLWQEIPGDEHCPARGAAVALVTDHPNGFFLDPTGAIILEAGDRESIEIFVGLASEFEGPGSQARAFELARIGAADGWDTLAAEHAAGWRQFWQHSAVQVDDPGLQQDWLRANYMLACNARGGRPALALCGVSIPYDHPPWRGDRHNNYPEYSGSFWGAFAANHEEQLRNYIEHVHGLLPQARQLARDIFELEAGAAFPHAWIDGSDLPWFHRHWSRSLFLPALFAQNVWWHYEYFGDRELLRELGWPIMREAATFYLELLRKNPPGDYTLWPTIATEIRGWTKDFRLNRDCIEDLAHVRFLMRAVQRATAELDTDHNLAIACREVLEHLAPYPTLVVDGRPEFVDFAGQEERPAYNHSVPLAPLWPAEDPSVIADPELRHIAEATLEIPNLDDVRKSIALLRLGRGEDVAAAHLGKSAQIRLVGFALGQQSCVVTAEMLLSAWDGVLRLFPGWPLSRRARFRNLRCKGAFLVSAACGDGYIHSVRIRSERGTPLCLLAPWSRLTVRDAAGRPVPAERHGKLLRLPTSAGGVYDFAEE